MRIVRSLEQNSVAKFSKAECPVAECPVAECSVTQVEDIPVDFRADPDGVWEFEALAEQLGFDPRRGHISVGALTQPYAGYPEGAAVVTLTTGGTCSVAFVDCTVVDRRVVDRRVVDRRVVDRRAPGETRACA
jgi:hypothetical protein